MFSALVETSQPALFFLLLTVCLPWIIVAWRFLVPWTGTPDLGLGAVSGEYRRNMLVIYLEDDDGHDWESDGGPVASHIYVGARLCRDFEAYCKLWSLDSATEQEESTQDFSMKLQDLKSFVEQNVWEPEKAVVLEPKPIV